MKYKVKFWNDSLRDFQVFEYPHLETAMMMAYKLCEKLDEPICVTDETMDNTWMIRSRH